MQIKLGISSIKYVKHLVKHNSKKCFIRADNKISSCVNYLVTTSGVEL
jgi:hypothetical protein